MGAHPPLREGISLDQAKKEVANHLASGEHLRQDARRVGDQFHDPTLIGTALAIVAQTSLEDWVAKKKRWIGLTSNALRDVFATREPAEAFNKAATNRGTATSDRDPQQRLDDETVAVDGGLGQLRNLKEQLEQDRRDSEQPEQIRVDLREKRDVPPLQDVPPLAQTASVFLVHGRNESVKAQVARTLEMTGQHPVKILHELPDRGRTVIEKFEEEASNAAYAVILITGDDVGRFGDEPLEQPRARQNVLFELGWFAGRLGRNQVTLLCEPQVELPSDYRGVAYTVLDEHGAWKSQLILELQAAGLDFDANKLRS